MLPRAKRLRRNINKTNPVSRVGLIFFHLPVILDKIYKKTSVLYIVFLIYREIFNKNGIVSKKLLIFIFYVI